MFISLLPFINLLIRSYVCRCSFNKGGVGWGKLFKPRKIAMVALPNITNESTPLLSPFFPANSSGENSLRQNGFHRKQLGLVYIISCDISLVVQNPGLLYVS